MHVTVRCYLLLFAATCCCIAGCIQGQGWTRMSSHWGLKYQKRHAGRPDLHLTDQGYANNKRTSHILTAGLTFRSILFNSGLTVHALSSINILLDERKLFNVCIRVSHYVSKMRFFKVLIMRQGHLPIKVPKQTNFRWSLQKLKAEIEHCANFFLMLCAFYLLFPQVKTKFSNFLVIETHLTVVLLWKTVIPKNYTP